jgi:hypothetical protein
MHFFHNLAYIMLFYYINVHSMGDPAFELHKMKFQGVLQTIETARRAEAGLPAGKVKGMFGNALSVPVIIYHNECFYEEVAPNTEILLDFTDGFTVYTPSQQKNIKVECAKEYFYAYIFLNQYNDIHIKNLSDLQTWALNANTTELRAMYTKKLAKMINCNE